MRVWVGNFDFEHELAGGLAYQRTKKLARINAELTAHLIPLCDADDALFWQAHVPRDFLKQLEDQGFPRIRRVSTKEQFEDAQLSPWGRSRSVIREFADSQPGPDFDVVRLVNSRAFAFELEKSLAALEFAREIHSVEELQDAIAGVEAGGVNSDFQWVLKSDFGMSGRERIRGAGSTIDDQAMRWMQKRLSGQQRLFFEPWLHRIDEFSVHWDIDPTPTDGPQLVGITQLLCDESGKYLGNRVLRIDQADAFRSQAILQTREIVEHIQAAGYFGPLGIDCMVHRTHEGKRLRIAQDVNARWSMGRVAICATRAIGEAEATLLHYPTSWFDEIDAGESIDVCTQLQQHWPKHVRRAIRTTPLLIDDATPFQTSVLVVDD
jgi:hypothetical protein